MRFLKRIVLFVVTPVAAVYIVGALLPVAHEASGRRDLPASPEQVFGVIADVAAYPRWWTDVTRVEMLASHDGRIRFVQHAGSDAIVMEVVEAAPNSRFVTRIADPGQPFGGTWTFELTPSAAGTLVTITERGEVYDPLFRFLSRFVFGHAGTLESCLDALAGHLRAVSPAALGPVQAPPDVPGTR
jgi:uncharacterized protein YndB with AHSA1/START domain